jgi:hypothetical protein
MMKTKIRLLLEFYSKHKSSVFNHFLVVLKQGDFNQIQTSRCNRLTLKREQKIRGVKGARETSLALEKDLKKQNPVLLKTGLKQEYRTGVITNARSQIPGQH